MMISALVDENGVVVNVATGLPKGYVECPEGMGKGDIYTAPVNEGESGVWAKAPSVPVPPKVFTGEDVNAARDRRIYSPATVLISGIGAINIDMNQQSQININGLVTSAILKKQIADTSEISFTDADNTERSLNPDQLIELGVQAMTYVSAIHAKAKLIKVMDPVPADFADDIYWT